MQYLYMLGFIFMMLFVGFSYHQQINGHPEERKECWKQGGILWHTLNQELICIVPGDK